jgi:hypothetical protein
MIDKDRRIGRTQQMLEKAVADDGACVFVVAHSQAYAADLGRRLLDMIPEGKLRPGVLLRPDGRRVVLLTATDSPERIAGLRGRHYVDHAVWELVGPRDDLFRELRLAESVADRDARSHP